MATNLTVDGVPADFDDADDPEGQVHAVARRLFSGCSNVEVFAKAQRWLGEHRVLLLDLSCDYVFDEPNPVWITLYFRFKDDDET